MLAGAPWARLRAGGRARLMQPDEVGRDGLHDEARERKAEVGDDRDEDEADGDVLRAAPPSQRRRARSSPHPCTRYRPAQARQPSIAATAAWSPA